MYIFRTLADIIAGNLRVGQGIIRIFAENKGSILRMARPDLLIGSADLSPEMAMLVEKGLRRQSEDASQNAGRIRTASSALRFRSCPSLALRSASWIVWG